MWRRHFPGRQPLHILHALPSFGPHIRPFLVFLKNRHLLLWRTPVVVLSQCVAVAGSSSVADSDSAAWACSAWVPDDCPLCDASMPAGGVRGLLSVARVAFPVGVVDRAVPNNETAIRANRVGRIWCFMPGAYTMGQQDTIPPGLRQTPVGQPFANFPASYSARIHGLDSL